MAAQLEPAPALVISSNLVQPVVKMEEQDQGGPEPGARAEGAGKAPHVVQAGTDRASLRWATPQWVKQEPVQRWQVGVSVLRLCCHTYVAPESGPLAWGLCSQGIKGLQEVQMLEQFLAVLPREMQSWEWGGSTETCSEVVTPAEGFQLGLMKDEMLQARRFHPGH